MNSQEYAIYEKLYSIVEREIIKQGQIPEYFRETFLHDIGTPVQNVDVSRFLELPNTRFYQAIYVNTMKHLPDQADIQRWKNKEDMSVSEFQKAVLNEMCNSRGIAINHIKFENNPYFKQIRGFRYYLWGIMYRITNKPSLRAFCRKLPDPIQNIIKRIFL